MTIVYGVHCKQAIIIQGDTKVTDSDRKRWDAAKLFPINIGGKPKCILGISGAYAEFELVRDAVKKRFEKLVTVPTEEKCVKLLRECKDEIHKKVNLERLERLGIQKPYDNNDFLPLEFLFATTILNKIQKQELALYKFMPNESPMRVPYIALGSGAPEMDHFFEMGRFALNRMKLDWSNLSPKLVAQITHFPMRYIPNVNDTIGKNYNSYILTGKDGCLEYPATEYFSETIKRKQTDLKWKMDYLPELVSTVTREVPKESLRQFLPLATWLQLRNFLSTEKSS